jgi:hypothetical protein
MEWIEGSRAFDIAWGTLTGCLCLSLAIPTLWWMLPKHARAIFPASVDPKQHLQLAYGIFTMGMAFTNFGCRFIDHRYLLGVHEGFALITLAVVLVMTPLVTRAAFFKRARTASLA